MIIGGAISALVVFFVIPSFFILRNKPTCSNGKQDSGEKGVDCGGSCRLVCEGDALAPLIHFTRALEVSSGIWGAVVSLENQNKDAGATSSAYMVKLYDADNLLVAERHGTVYIPPNKIFAVFEGALDVGWRVPTRATFEFTAPIRFETMAPDPVIDIRSKRFTQSVDGSRLDVSLYNPARTAVQESELVALLFDSAGNVFASSATLVKELSALSSTNISFTWPRELQDPARIEVLSTVSGVHP